jgi:hypothetical protein
MSEKKNKMNVASGLGGREVNKRMGKFRGWKGG